MKEFNIAKEYTKNPGARYISQGENSGEDFRKRILEPYFENRKKEDILCISFDGLNGYPSTFFEEAFGGIAREYSPNVVLKALKFECNENPLFIDDIISYIKQERT